MFDYDVINGLFNVHPGLYKNLTPSKEADHACSHRISSLRIFFVLIKYC